MASAILHIKDSYYFEVPKFLWASERRDKSEFPDVWIRNDPQFQDWEAQRLAIELETLERNSPFGLPETGELLEAYRHWKESDHANFGKPFDAYLEEQSGVLHQKYQIWKQQPANQGKDVGFGDWLAAPEQSGEPGLWFARQLDQSAWAAEWNAAKARAGDLREFKRSEIVWSPAKIRSYNQHLSGKILIPQPFGELKNLYEADHGLVISKFMIIELLVGLIMCLAFSWFGRRIASGAPARGRLANLLEAFLLFIRDEVARKAIHGDHGHEHETGGQAHDEHGPAEHAGDSHGGHHHHAAPAHGETAHGNAQSAAAPAVHLEHHEADKYVPLLWTIFFFILGCNLMGILPWLGSPTGVLPVTFALASITFLTGLLYGSIKFGFMGYWLNQIPHMDLHWLLAILLKPPIFLIEVLGLFIKHGVLAVRLLANMVAGHLVLLTIMAVAFSVEGAASPNWGISAVASLVGSAALSALELGVAFLQAYVFTLLSALFIGAATSRH